MSVEAIEVVAGLTLAGARPWAQAATGWQVADMQALLDEVGPRSHYITRPRGGSKSTDMAAALVALLTTGNMRGEGHVWAVDRDQAALVLAAARELVQATPQLSGLLDFTTVGMSSTVWGGRVKFMAADAGGSYGLRSEFLVLDELAQWPETPTHRTVFEAVLSTRQKVPGCRLVVATSAGSPDHFSFELLESARSSAAWRVSETPGPLPWVDADDLADQRRLLPESVFKRLHLNEWTSGEDRLASWEDIRACVRRSRPTAQPDGRVSRYAIGLDVGIKHDATVAAVMHRGDDWALRESGSFSEEERIDRGLAEALGRDWVRQRPRSDGAVFVLDEIHRWVPGRFRKVDLSEVEATLVSLAAKYKGAKLIFDPHQALYLSERLRAHGVRTQEFTFSAQSVGRLAVPLFEAIRQHRLDLYDDDALLNELAGVQLAETAPGSFRLDHPRGRHDDQAVAIALAMSELLARPPGPTSCRVIDRRLAGRR